MQPVIGRGCVAEADCVWVRGVVPNTDMLCACTFEMAAKDEN